tara:strand:- start:14742 stop:15704 length:963 start_codon:yes stop_codon:yes gene_type:complete
MPNTRLAGRYKYRIIDANGATVRESPWQNNLVLDTGLQALTSAPLTTVAKVLTFGSSDQATAVTDTGVISATQDTSKFANLSALTESVTHTNDAYQSSYEWTYRTWGADYPVTIREYTVQPSCDVPAFARALLSIDLERQQGIEFTYNLDVTWPSTTTKTELDAAYIISNTAGVSSLNTVSIILSASPYFNPPVNNKVVCEEYKLYTLTDNIIYPTKFNNVIYPATKSFTTGDSNDSQGSRISTVYTATSAVMTYFIATSAVGDQVKTLLLAADDLVAFPDSEFFASTLYLSAENFTGADQSWESSLSNLKFIITHSWGR